MKILMSAYACEPDKGSEAAVGWNWALQAAEIGEVWVVTRSNNRESIERALRHNPVPSLHFIYHDLPDSVRRFKRGARGLNLYYLLWQLSAIPLGKQLHRQEGFDIGHHITFVSFRAPSFLAWIDIPFVWGPVAGADRIPLKFYSQLSLLDVLREVSREINKYVARLNPFVRHTVRNADAIMAATPETADYLSGWSGKQIPAIQAVGFDAPRAVNQALDSREPTSEGLALLYVGNLLGLKGLTLSLKAFEKFRSTGGKGSFTIVGSGPMSKRLFHLAKQLGIDDSVTFVGQLPRNEVLSLYPLHDAFVFPSLRDSGGMVLLEAMGARLAVISLDIGGPSLIVAPGSGIRVQVETPEQVINDLADSFRLLQERPDLRRELGDVAFERVTDVYPWSRKKDVLRDIYDHLVMDTQ